MDRKKIIDKIAKCLRLSTSSNANEAAAALRQVQRLMEKYGISDQEVDSASISEASITSGTRNRPSFWLSKLADLVAKAYGLTYFLEEHHGVNRYVFVGPDPAPEVATYTFTVLRRQVSRDRKTFYKKTRGKLINRIRKADIFASGWVYAVSNTVHEFAQPHKVIKAIQSYMALYHAELSTYTSASIKIKSRDINAMVSGMDSAKNVQLNHGVNNNDCLLLK